MKPRSLLLLTVNLLLMGAAPGGDEPGRSTHEVAEEGLSTRESLDRLDKAFDRGADTSVPLDLTLGDSLVVLRLKEKPLQIRTSDPRVLDYVRVSPRSVALSPQRKGAARLGLSFGGAGPKKGFTLTVAANVKPYVAKGGGEKRLPNPESLDRLKRAFGRRADAEVPLDLTVGQPFVLPVKEKPFFFMIPDPKVLDFKVLGPRKVELQPLKVGRIPMAIWFGDEKDEKTHVVFTLKVKVWAKEP